VKLAARKNADCAGCANWRQAEAAPVNCTIDVAKVIAVAVIDDQIAKGIWSWASEKNEHIRKIGRYKP
jgi:hypothetical protein